MDRAPSANQLNPVKRETPATATTIPEMSATKPRGS